MPSTYSPDLRVELIANGEKTGAWGAITNSNLGTILEDAISGLASVIVTTANQALTALNGAPDQARCAAVSLSTTTVANFAVYVPPVTKLYVVRNTSAYVATVYASTVIGNTTAAGAGIAIPAGKSVLVRCDGVNIVEQMNHVAGDFGFGGGVAVAGALTVADTAAVTGILTAPTAALGTNTTQAATTAFVQAAMSALLPSGVITMWSGSIVSIPTGWLLCNGSSGTPDLRDRFIVGAGSTYAPAATGGSANAVVVSHTHTESNPGNFITGSVNVDIAASAGVFVSPSGVFSTSSPDGNFAAASGPSGFRDRTLSITAGSHTHTINSTGVSDTNANLPPYYALAYIMKS